MYVLYMLIMRQNTSMPLKQSEVLPIICIRRGLLFSNKINLK